MPRLTFPNHRDLAFLSLADAEALLSLLRRLHAAELMGDPYTQPFTPKGERPRWNLWLSRTVWPAPAEQRVELHVFADAWLATRRASDEAATRRIAAVLVQQQGTNVLPGDVTQADTPPWEADGE